MNSEHEPNAPSQASGDFRPTVTVDAKALERVLKALIGPGHLIRELQATMSLHDQGFPNPVMQLLGEYNAQVNAMNAQQGQDKERTHATPSP